MKKLLSIVLALCIAAGVFLTGCGTNAKPASSTPAQSASVAPSQSSSESPSQSDASTAPVDKYAGVDAPKFKIGFSYYSFQGLDGITLKKVLEYTAQQFNCEIVCQEWVTMDLEGMQQTNKNLMQAGCDGIINTMLTPGMLQDAEAAGIPIVLSDNSIADPSMLSAAAKSNSYVGSITDDDMLAGYDMAQALYDTGSRNWIYGALPMGMSPAHDNRVKGIEKFLEEHKDVTLISGVRDYAKLPDSVRQAWTAHPETDGVLVIANDGAILTALYADGLQSKIKVSAITVTEDLGQYFEDGCLVWVADGWFSTSQVAFAMLYNKLSGHDLVSDKSVSLSRSYIYVKNAQELADYTKYIMNSSIPAYSGDELKDLCVAYNPDATLDMFNLLNEKYSLQDVIDRHQNLQ